MSLKFEWHPRKAAQNKRKHGVSFEEASTVFADPLSASASDPEHSYDEERFILIGYSDKNRLLMVSHTERYDRIRIISARELTPLEREEYEQYT
ncbi:MAG: BrnT family toxin [Chloroflexi bacterium]|nr:BrnT family toxin [Chloroflexota bacterium]MDA0246114.1 BrnT family toxin [Chloroflexota bacterium]